MGVCKQTTGMLNIVAALLIFVSVINALSITLPTPGSAQQAGTAVQFLIVNGLNEEVPSVTLTLIGANNVVQTIIGLPVGTLQPVVLNANLIGNTIIRAVDPIGAAVTATSNIYVYRNNPIPYPIYNPCYNPYWNTGCYNPCKIPRNNCYRPVCNVPRPRCRIRATDASESTDAVEFIQAESQPEILYSGFAVFVSRNFDEQEQEEQVQEVQQQEQQEQQQQQEEQEQQQEQQQEQEQVQQVAEEIVA